MNKKYLLSFLVACIVTAASVIYFLPSANSPATLFTKRKGTSPDWQADIANFSGDGTPGFVNGTASTAQFSDPYGLVTDRQGNVYVADAGENNLIRKLSPAGIVTTFAGTSEGYIDGTAAEAKFNTPSGLAIDVAGNLYVADTGNNVIRKISPTGQVSTLAGNGKAGYRDGDARQAEFNGPVGVAVDAAGNVLVTDTYNDRIRSISASGQVTTLAGSGVPGYFDAQGGDARFDSPCAVAVNSKGEIIVADTKNNALRVISPAGQVSTLYRSLPEDRDAPFRRPVSLAITSDDFVYVGTMKDGQVFQFAPGGALRALNDPESDLAVPRKIVIPYGLALNAQGELLVADAPAFLIRKLAPARAGQAATVAARPVVMPVTGKFLWPLQPQHVAHEIVGTMGEDRGNDKGESRDHFHAGLDVRANMGSKVLAIADGKVSDPLAAWGYGNLSEGISIGAITYIHMRVGRDEKNVLLDPDRFISITDDQNKLRIRVKRGTRFAVGDAVGSVNRMFHVHLEYSPLGEQVNPFNLGLPGYADKIAPHIENIQVTNQAGTTIDKNKKGELHINRTAGNLRIIVNAYDQSNGNETRRRLGIYKLGYQILHRDGQPLAGYEAPRFNIEFNQVPSDKAIKIAYADGSGETVHGSATTKFLYVVTNVVRDGVAQEGFWNPADLLPGDYLIRICAADFAGNVATTGRDLPVTID